MIWSFLGALAGGIAGDLIMMYFHKNKKSNYFNKCGDYTDPLDLEDNK